MKLKTNKLKDFKMHKIVSKNYNKKSQKSKFFYLNFHLK
jgi:hypothetical protein